VQGVKDVLGCALQDRVAQGLRYVGAWNAAFLASHDLGEALQAFHERRPGNFTGA
ncbi:MAG: enoyl-CoA hydratase, partial [Actinobacteria bacterium]|nr:enoyl-CoA hydratase [Actinomycetota bacterium]